MIDSLSSRPYLLVIRGPVGAGKTSVGTELRNHIGDASIVDFDSFKRQIDNTKSSDWRREMALKTAGYLTELLMESKRNIIIDIHSSSKEQYNLYVKLAAEYGYALKSYLLYPPLETCKQRAAGRTIEDISYSIDTAMIEKYWNETFFIDGEERFDDPNETAQIIVGKIMNSEKLSSR